jgi:hypothetical protein
MFVGTTIRLGHEHAVLPQGGGLEFPLTDCLPVFDEAPLCFRRRASPAWDFYDIERVRQPFTNQVNSVSALDATAW